MKMLAEYLDNAIQFEQMAADEKDPKLKAEFERPPLIASARKREPRNMASSLRPKKIGAVRDYALERGRAAKKLRRSYGILGPALIGAIAALIVAVIWTARHDHLF